MSTSFIPSKMLLRIFAKPTACPTCQVRMVSGYMPRSRYHKPNGLDKLHRKQKQEIRKERQATHDRAAKMIITPPSMPVSPSTPPPSSLSPSTQNQPAQSVFPFTISRTTARNIPVYETSKSGGSKHITQIRRLSGNIDAMASELRKVLNLPETYTDVRGRKKESITINRLTNHVIVRGWRGAEVKKWAEGLGF